MARGGIVSLADHLRHLGGAHLLDVGPDHGLAQRLYIADNTVKTHVKRILAEIGARHRAQAVVAAYESGLVR